MNRSARLERAFGGVGGVLGLLQGLLEGGLSPLMDEDDLVVGTVDAW